MQLAEKQQPTRPKRRLGPITYQRIFWLFIVGSLIGVPIEGLWCLARYGHWETHVVTIWGPFCIIYGLGMVGCYIGAVLLQGKNIFLRFLTFTAIGTVVEFICGWVLEYGLHMRAWDYSNTFMNIKGYVALGMSLAWGALGIAFGLFVPAIDALFAKMQGWGFRLICILFTVFMIVDFALTTACFIRWKNRHESVMAVNRFEVWIDETYYDDFMEKRFCEWRFIDN